jgi:hypothetical protein
LPGSLRCPVVRAAGLTALPGSLRCRLCALRGSLRSLAHCAARLIAGPSPPLRPCQSGCLA